MKKVIMLGAAVLSLQAVPALAQEKGGEYGKPRGEKFFDMHDADKDGVVTEAEFVAKAKERFVAMDFDKDGKVTKEEMASKHEEMKKKWQERRAEKMKEKAGESTTPSPDVVAPVTQ